MGAALPAISLGAQLGSSILGGISGQNTAAYQANVARMNQQIAGQDAAQAIGAGESQAEIQSLRTGQEVGAAKAAQAAKGIDVNVGSALDVQNSILTAGRINAATTRSNARRAAYGYQVEGAGYGAQAQLDQSQSNAALPDALISGGSTLAGNWSRMQQQGINPLDVGIDFDSAGGAGASVSAGAALGYG